MMVKEHMLVPNVGQININHQNHQTIKQRGTHMKSPATTPSGQTTLISNARTPSSASTSSSAAAGKLMHTCGVEPLCQWCGGRAVVRAHCCTTRGRPEVASPLLTSPPRRWVRNGSERSEQVAGTQL